MEIKKKDYDNLHAQKKTYGNVFKAIFKGPKALDRALKDLHEKDMQKRENND